MPLNYAGNWEDVGNAFNNLGGSMSGIAVGLAQQRFQQEQARQNMMLHMMQLQQQQQLYKAHEGLYGAQTAEAQARAGQASAEKDYLTQKTADALGNVRNSETLGDIVDYIARNPNMPADQMQAFRGKAQSMSARLMGSGNAHAVQGVNQLLSAVGGNTPMGDVLGAGQAAHLYVPLPQGSAAFNPVTGQQATAPFTLGPEQQRFTGSVPQLNLGAAGAALQQGGVPTDAARPIATNTMVRPQSNTPEERRHAHNVQLLGDILRAGGGMMPTSTNMLSQIYPTFTNLLGQVNQTLATPPTQGLPPGVPPTGAQPLPTDKSKLVKGQRYQTARGEAMWDGTQFVK